MILKEQTPKYRLDATQSNALMITDTHIRNPLIIETKLRYTCDFNKPNCKNMVIK